MEKQTAERIKALIGDNQLEAALNLMIGSEQVQGLERHNTLLLMKGKLAMIKEQEMAGLLDIDEVMQQKLKIAHALLKMLDEKPAENPIGTSQPTQQAEVRKQAPAPSGKPLAKYIFIGLGLVVAAFLLFKFSLNKPADGAGNEQRHTQRSEQTAETESPAPAPTDQPLKLMGFPNLERPFNFLDFGLEFTGAEAEWISDQAIRLKIRYSFTCKSNLGICYRAAIRIYADGKPIAPASQSNLDGWIDHNASASDEAIFELPARAGDFLIEFSRDNSTWKRPFKILK